MKGRIISLSNLFENIQASDSKRSSKTSTEGTSISVSKSASKSGQINKLTEARLKDDQLFIIVLYKSSHQEFRRLFLEHLPQILQKMNDATVFVPETLDKDFRETILTDEQIDEIAKRFKIKPDQLPGAFTFKGFNSTQHGYTSLTSVNTKKDVISTFSKLSNDKFLSGVLSSVAFAGTSLVLPTLLPLLIAGASVYLARKKLPDFLYKRIDEKDNTNILPHQSISIVNDNQKILNLLEKIAEDIKIGFTDTGKKIDTLTSQIEKLNTRVENIKNYQRDYEEKFNMMVYMINQNLQTLIQQNAEDMKMYENNLKKLIPDWYRLELLSKELLIAGEFLYDQFHSNNSNIDYSPVVLQYCRSLEYELQQKIYVNFFEYINFRKENDESLLKYLNETEKNKGDFFKFVKKINQFSKNPDNVDLTMGEMNEYLVHTSKDSNVKSYRIIAEFHEFLTLSFDGKGLLNSQFRSKISKITDDYRNKAAHPNKLILANAAECKNKVILQINEFLDFARP